MATTVKFSNEQEARQFRDSILASTDWTQLPDAERRITHKTVEDFRRYRENVYNVKHQPTWPLEAVFPDEPAIERQEDAMVLGPAYSVEMPE